MDSGRFSWILNDSNLSTKDKVWALRIYDPDMLAIEISRLVGRTRERIRQILNDLNLETAVADRIGRSKSSNTNCLACGKDTGSKIAKSCSRECWTDIYAAETWSFKCPNCGTFKTIRESLRRVMKKRGHNNIFCCRPCFYEFRIGWSHLDLSSFRNLWVESI